MKQKTLIFGIKENSMNTILKFKALTLLAAGYVLAQEPVKLDDEVKEVTSSTAAAATTTDKVVEKKDAYVAAALPEKVEVSKEKVENKSQEKVVKKPEVKKISPMKLKKKTNADDAFTDVLNEIKGSFKVQSEECLEEAIKVHHNHHATHHHATHHAHSVKKDHEHKSAGSSHDHKPKKEKKKSKKAKKSKTAKAKKDSVKVAASTVEAKKTPEAGAKSETK